MVSLKYRSNFWGTLEIWLINCEIPLMSTWTKNCFLISDYLENQNPKFTITDTTFDVPVVTLSTQDKVKLMKQLEPGFKKAINWNQSKLIH